MRSWLKWGIHQPVTRGPAPPALFAPMEIALSPNPHGQRACFQFCLFVKPIWDFHVGQRCKKGPELPREGGGVELVRDQVGRNPAPTATILSVGSVVGAKLSSNPKNCNRGEVHKKSPQVRLVVLGINVGDLRKDNHGRMFCRVVKLQSDGLGGLHNLDP